MNEDQFIKIKNFASECLTVTDLVEFIIETYGHGVDFSIVYRIASEIKTRQGMQLANSIDLFFKDRERFEGVDFVRWCNNQGYFKLSESVLDKMREREQDLRFASKFEATKNIKIEV